MIFFLYILQAYIVEKGEGSRANILWKTYLIGNETQDPQVFIANLKFDLSVLIEFRYKREKREGVGNMGRQIRVKISITIKVTNDNLEMKKKYYLQMHKETVVLGTYLFLIH